MALMRIDHSSEFTMVNLPLYIILPNPGEMGKLPLARRKVLYLLHGLSDDGSAWQRYTQIELFARQYGLVVVMPSVERSFYTDLPNGQKFFSYLVEELPHYLKDVFGLSPARADTLIAGNSVGGFGAMKAALLHPEFYSAAGSFSGAFSIDFINDRHHADVATNIESQFGSLDKLAGSEDDPDTWLRRAARHPQDLPKLYVSCGLQDVLLPFNQAFYSNCQALGIAVDYHEQDGIHDWFFWNEQIQCFLAAHLTPV